MRGHIIWRALCAAFLSLLSACATPVVSGDAALRCDIRMTQLGFSPAGPKRAIIESRADAPVVFVVRNAGGRAVYKGLSQPLGHDGASGKFVHLIDISGDLSEGGGYVINACGGTSHPFRVASDIYAGLSEDALKYFYHSRIGTEILVEHVQDAKWARRAALPSVKATCYQGEDKFGNEWPGCGYTLDATGGWFDAGDFGVYSVSMGVAIWTLQNAYERLSVQNLLRAANWEDGRISLPETGNGVSEILDEARWGMENLLALQVPEGEKVWVAADRQVVVPGRKAELSQIDGSGLVHHKLAGKDWPPQPIWPWEDAQERFLYPPSTAATLTLAATGAQCTRLWTGIDDTFAGRCFAAAERAWQAAMRHPDILASDNFNGSGAYGESELSDEFAWAAAELYITSGDEAYLQHLQESLSFSRDYAGFSWGSVGLKPSLSLALAGAGRNRDIVDRAREQVTAAADTILAIRDREGFRVPITSDEYDWGSNKVPLNRGLVLAAAYDITGKIEYRDGAVDAMDYILGRNVLDQSYVTGYGTRPMTSPHHRFWAGAVNPDFPPPPPGVVSGGPNNRVMADGVARAMRGKCAPMACWKDNAWAYSLNEVTVDWNAPLAALAIFLDQTEREIRLRPATETNAEQDRIASLHAEPALGMPSVI